MRRGRDPCWLWCLATLFEASSEQAEIAGKSVPQTPCQRIQRDSQSIVKQLRSGPDELIGEPNLASELHLQIWINQAMFLNDRLPTTRPGLSISV